ncbi:zn-finger domain-containing protein [Gigaspora margarita]|uniref:Zn-finger domain-containing protein n=1 Tax=Gigaspora margarita TaxID=4874 RepID=A0A8H4AVJ4_GIGMA|nr:zn-finger domain-containing protein [Gigaspora margarita]
MNNMKSNLSYKKTKVLDYDNTEYFLYYMQLMSCIQKILEISDISQTFALEYEELYKTTKCRNRQNTKQLLGYLLIIKSSNVRKEIKRQLFHKYLDIILEPIQTFSEKETNLLLNNKFIWFYPNISTIITDWPEAATFCLTYKLTKSKYPCHFCLVKKNNLTNTKHNKKDMKLRNYENMQYYYNSNEEQIVSIESIPNIFWKFKNINIYKAIVIDRIHHLDLELFNYQITFTYNLLKELHGASILDKLDNRLANISRFP